MSDSGDERIILHDEASGSKAEILSALGFNCYRFTPVVDGEPVETIWAAPDFSVESRASGSGIPILFPFAGRLHGPILTYQSHEYQITDGLESMGNVIHGFVLNRPWRVIEQTGSRAVGQFRASQDDPVLLKQWPADFQITVAYEVSGTSLLCDVVITNPDQKNVLPFGFGTHPYFRVPIGAGVADDCRVTVPANTAWVQAEHLPTGERKPVQGGLDLRDGFPFGTLKIDDILTDLQASGGRIRTEIADPVSGHRIVQTFDDSFRECIVYVAPHRESVAVEPYTCVPNAFVLASKGIETGLRTLAPGEEFTAQITIDVK